MIKLNVQLKLDLLALLTQKTSQYAYTAAIFLIRNSTISSQAECPISHLETRGVYTPLLGVVLPTKRKRSQLSFSVIRIILCRYYPSYSQTPLYHAHTILRMSADNFLVHYCIKTVVILMSGWFRCKAQMEHCNLFLKQHNVHIQ